MVIPEQITKTIHWCVHCSEECSGKYCNGCSTVVGRKKLDDEQEKVKQENLAKGYIYK